MSKKVVVRARKKGTNKVNKVVLSDIANVKEKSTPIIEDRGTEESELEGVEQFNSEEQSADIKQESEQVEDAEQGVDDITQEPEQVENIEQGVAIKHEPEQVENIEQSNSEEQSVAIEQEPEQVEDILQSDLEEQSAIIEKEPEQFSSEGQITDIKQEPEQVENMGGDIEQISVYDEEVALTKNEMQVSDIAILDEDEKGKRQKSGKNKSLLKAKQKKNDEFYTTYEMIEQELMGHSEYRKYFKDKTILCNCDDPFWSKFYTFFNDVAVKWGIQRLIITTYKNTLSDDKVVALDWDRGKDCIISDNTLIPRIYPLQGNGDFASDECIEYLKQSDIVVTNPPFSKLGEYVDLLMKYNKDFVLIVPVPAIATKSIFPYIQNNKIKIGYTFNKTAACHTKERADTAYNKIITSCNICFITTLNLDKQKEFIPLNCLYYGNEENYPMYVNYPAINVDKIKDIPKDYYGVMGVPITFLGSHCEEQFKILGLTVSLFSLPDDWQGLSETFINTYKQQNPNKRTSLTSRGKSGFYDGKGKAIVPYQRILVQRRFWLADDIECNYYNILIDYLELMDYWYSTGVITTMLIIENNCIMLQNRPSDYIIQTDCIFDNEPHYMYEISRKG